MSRSKKKRHVLVGVQPLRPRGADGSLDIETAAALPKFVQRQRPDGDTLDAIYASIPEMECKGLCQHDCTHIGIMPVEVRRFQERGIALPAAHPETGMCSHLTEDGKCAIYAERPYVCRLWGTTPMMVCPHGCRPKRILSTEEVVGLMARMVALCPDGGVKPLFTANESQMPGVQAFLEATAAGEVGAWWEPLDGVI